VGAAITFLVTVNTVDPDTLPTVALIDVDPAPIVVASPTEPLSLLIEAAPADDEPQTAVVVRFWRVLSLNVPVAVNCSVTPVVAVGLLGVTAIDTSVAFGAATVSVVEPETPADSADTVVAPIPTALARPGLLGVPNVATVVVLDAQVTEDVRFWVEPSEYAPVALNCCVVPGITVTSDGATVIDTSRGPEAMADELEPPQPLSAKTSAQQMATTGCHRQQVRLGEFRCNASEIKSTASTTRRPHAATDIVIAPPGVERVYV
jgi:hypothetical protein